ncbi:MAG TPA: hypothetical protein VFH58_06815 [Acidimicrobiales bacterium]|nr:hypothetical protein [Acidimicrobiales bacterium]
MRDLSEPSPMSQAAFEAMMRRWVLKVSVRYVPLLAVGLAVTLILVFVPTKQPNSGFPTAAGNVNVAGSGPGYQAGSPGATGGAAGPTGAASGAVATGAAGGTGATGAGTVAGTSNSGTGQTGAASGSATTTPGSGGAASAAAVAKTGVRCGPGVRQFTWSQYAPDCVGAFQGSNGGATGQGVTATTITLTYRLANTAQQQAIDSLAGAANVNQDAYVKDLQSYINYFNTQFELYGRKVVLKTYQGQGDYIQEDQGQGLAATQADAVTAHDMGAFGDVTFSLTGSQAYEEDLAAEHVIGFSSIGLSQQWFEQHAPYEYSVQGPTGTTGTTEAANLVCRRMAGMSAIYAGPAFQHSNRVFGIIYPQTPVYTAEVNQWEQMLASGCNVHVAKTVGYSINVAAYEEEAASAMAQMNSAHVTTLLCACDPIADIFLSNAAHQQQYVPEWFVTYFGDPIGRNYDQTEWSHVITGGFAWPDYTTTEPYRTFERGYPSKQPAETPPTSPRYYYAAYYTLLQIFDALQAAGPSLNAYTFERGMFSLPPSAPGDFIGGQWHFGQNVFDPITSYTLAWWDPNAVSKFDDTKGAYEWCNNAQVYSIFSPAALGGPRQQLACFGH